MKNPCKKCIVRAACSQSCKEYDYFVHKSSEWATFISLLGASLILMPILFYLSNQMDQGKEWPELVTTFIWIGGFIISTILQAPFDEEDKVGFVVRILFSPFIAICFIFFYIMKPYCKRGGT
jgi:hypothetical protein